MQRCNGIVMRKLLLTVPIILLAMFSCAFATSTSINNPDFENVYLNSSLARYFPSEWGTGNALLTEVLDSTQLEFIYGGSLDGFVTTASHNGTYSYATAYEPSNWNSSYSQSFIGVYAHQSLIRSADSHFVISGYYKFNYTDNITVATAESELRIDPLLSISFRNATDSVMVHDWEFFEVEYDNGFCSVLSGSNLLCSVPSYSASTRMHIFTGVNSFPSAQNISNSTMTFAFDDLQIRDYNATTGVGDYYDQYQQGLTGYSYTESSCIKATTSCTKIYSGKVMDSMKTRWLNISFEGCDFYFFDHGYASTVNDFGFDYFRYWNGTDWVGDSTYNNFEATSDYWTGSHSCYLGLHDGEFFTEVGDPISTGYKTRSASIGFIVPKEATQFVFDIRRNSGKGYSGCTGESYGDTTIYFNLSDSVQVSSSPIDTSMAIQSLPTFFPMITQYIEQSGKNFTSYHLQLLKWRNDAYSMKIYWINQEMNSYSTGTIYNQTYNDYTYDSTAWAINTDDVVWYNKTGTSYEYFGESFRPSSYYMFNSFTGGLCPSYCASGSRFVGTYSSGACYYIEYPCHSDCLPENIDMFIEDLDVQSAKLNWTQMDSHYWELRSENGTYIMSGSTPNRYVTLSGLDTTTSYKLYVNGSERYGCVLDYENETGFTTLSISTPSTPYTEAIINASQSVNTMIELGVSGFAVAMGTDEPTAKNMIWLIISIIGTISIVGVLASKTENMDLTVVFPIVMLMFMGLGWAFGWLDIFWMVLLGISIGLILLFKFQSMGGGVG